MKVCIREIVNVCARIGINKCREYKRYSFIDTLNEPIFEETKKKEKELGYYSENENILPGCSPI